jgi:hypothetical protein
MVSVLRTAATIAVAILALLPCATALEGGRLYFRAPSGSGAARSAVLASAAGLPVSAGDGLAWAVDPLDAALVDALDPASVDGHLASWAAAEPPAPVRRLIDASAYLGWEAATGPLPRRSAAWGGAQAAEHEDPWFPYESLSDPEAHVGYSNSRLALFALFVTAAVFGGAEWVSWRSARRFWREPRKKTPSVTHHHTAAFAATEAADRAAGDRASRSDDAIADQSSPDESGPAAPRRRAAPRPSEPPRGGATPLPMWPDEDASDDGGAARGGRDPVDEIAARDEAARSGGLLAWLHGTIGARGKPRVDAKTRSPAASDLLYNDSPSPRDAANRRRSASYEF